MYVDEKYMKSQGTTETERYLSSLCQKTFLSMWSYPNVFRQLGSELCDLIVIFGRDIIIFSDKSCAFPKSGNLELDWNRWFKRAISKSANQLWGAENWIRRHSDRIYLDPQCIHKIPYPIEINSKTRIHLVLVAHGGSEACKLHHGGSGSMIFQSEVVGLKNHTTPFVIGDLEPSKSFVHILDDTTLDILLKERDTISDFVEYIVKREKFLRSGIIVFSTGEEEMLASFLQDLNEKGEHDFVVPSREEPVNGMIYLEGDWDEYLKNPQRLAKNQANKISYSWDKIIEKFTHHALNETQYKASSNGISGTEASLRIMAGESRFMRRLLSESIHEILESTPQKSRMIRVIRSDQMEGLAYILLLFPSVFATSHAQYRAVREGYLKSTCIILRLMNPDLKHIVGFATETGHERNRSEDLMYFNCENWTPELEEQAKKEQSELGILTKPITLNRNEKEYPDLPNKNQPRKFQRNDPCPCGSGIKYKKCHGK